MHTDTIYVELVVVAVLWDDDIHMQGDISISINGETPYSIDYIVDANELLKSVKEDGDYFIFSCSCGVPECCGWTKGIRVSHDGAHIKWFDQDNKKLWCFDKENALKQIAEMNLEVEEYKDKLKDKNIEYIGYGA